MSASATSEDGERTGVDIVRVINPNTASFGHSRVWATPVDPELDWLPEGGHSTLPDGPIVSGERDLVLARRGVRAQAG